VKTDKPSPCRAVLFGGALVAVILAANLWIWSQQSRAEPRELLIEVLPEEILEVTAPEWEEVTAPSAEDDEPGVDGKNPAAEPSENTPHDE
jgi:hypothetical protein